MLPPPTAAAGIGIVSGSRRGSPENESCCVAEKANCSVVGASGSHFFAAAANAAGTVVLAVPGRRSQTPHNASASASSRLPASANIVFIEGAAFSDEPFCMDRAGCAAFGRAFPEGVDGFVVDLCVDMIGPL